MNTLIRSDSKEIIRIIEEVTGVFWMGLSSFTANALFGIYSEYSDDNCERCFKTGQLIKYDAVDGNVITDTCSCVKFQQSNKQTKDWVEQSGIPERYREARVEEWQNPGANAKQKKNNDEVITLVTTYVNSIKRMRDKGYGLYLTGPNGVGKTYLACAIGLQAIRQGFGVKYYTMSKIIRVTFDGWATHDSEQKDIAKDIESIPFLIIDDIDKPYSSRSKVEVSILDNLFRERMQNNRPMIVTGNKIDEQLKLIYGTSFFSMFSEHCVNCVIVGNDYRAGIAKQVEQDILKGDG